MWMRRESMVTSFAEAAEVVRSTVISKYPQVSRAFIFGSFAEGEQGSGSDLDVLVELKAPMGLAFIALIQDIEKAAGTSVDVLTIKQAKDLEEKYNYEIIKNARVVYDRAEN
jgi:predicted nucleotidyltransferase